MDRYYETIVDAEGHVPIPNEIRERHHLSIGSRVKISERGDEVVIAPSIPVTKYRSLSDLVGVLGSNSRVIDTLLEERRKDRKNEDRPFGA
jgi:bifunctional DNA-binding transcriptional regulator/antitoxin component of YhaV-PrlF toxin-antitoxin module